MASGPIETAYKMANTGRYANFTAIKKALRGRFAVDRDLVGRALQQHLTRICQERQRNLAEAEPPHRAEEQLVEGFAQA
jgi:hypothetical protein